MTHTTRYRLFDANIASEHFGGEAVVVNLMTGVYYSMPKVASHIWSRILSGYSVDASATNTTTYHSGISDRKIGVMQFPLNHPDQLTPDKAADDRLEWLIHSGYVYRQLQIARQRIHQLRHTKG